MNDDPTPTLMSIGRCFVGAIHGPSDKANDKVSVVNWNSGIRMAPSSKYCSAQRYAPATDTPRNYENYEVSAMPVRKLTTTSPSR
jgi:hypothetical protein